MSKRKMILSVNADSKTIKGVKQGYLTGILYLAPHTLAGGANVCPNAENAGCVASCLYSAGRGGFNSVKNARIAKTKRYHDDNQSFMLDLSHSIAALVRKAEREGLTPCVRLNGTSDINWANEYIKLPNNFNINLFDLYPNVQFYDYTKQPRTVSHYQNYHLTFSYSGLDSYKKTVKNALKRGMNIAVVFRGELPKTFLDLPVINGDDSDLRFLDKSVGPCIVGLKAKGKAKKEENDFVVDTNKLTIISLAA